MRIVVVFILLQCPFLTFSQNWIWETENKACKSNVDDQGRLTTVCRKGTDAATDIIVAKYDELLNEEWVVEYGSDDQDDVSWVFCDALGNCYVGGISRGWGGNNMSTYILKMSPKGDVLWHKFLDGGGWDQPGACQLRESDMTLHCFTKSFVSATGDIHYLKLDTAGQVLVERKMDLPSGEELHPGTQFLFGKNGEMYISAFGLRLPNSFGKKDLIIFKLDSMANVIWGKQIGGADDEGNGELCYANADSTELYVGATSLSYSSNGGSDILLVKLDSSGQVLWAKGLGTDGHDRYSPGAFEYEPSTGYLTAIITHVAEGSFLVSKSTFLKMNDDGDIVSETGYEDGLVFETKQLLKTGDYVLKGSSAGKNLVYLVSGNGLNGCSVPYASLLEEKTLLVDTDVLVSDITYLSYDYFASGSSVVSSTVSTMAFSSSFCGAGTSVVKTSYQANDSICPGDTIKLIAEATYPVEWSNLTTSTIIGYSDTLSLAVWETTTFSAMDLGFVSDSVDVHVESAESCYGFETSVSTEVICPGDTIQLNATSTRGIVWEKLSEEIVVGQGSELEISIFESSFYMARDTFNVRDSVYVHVKNIKECVEFKIFSLFSPNGDDVNDVFMIQGWESYGPVEVNVFTKSGEKLFESNDYKNNWSANDVPDGTYYYVIRANGEDYTGALKIIR